MTTLGSDEPPVAVFTVHGTGDRAPNDDQGLPLDDGEKWFQRGSQFSDWLLAKLAARGIDAEIFPLHWTGDNKASGREAAARSLAGEIKRKVKSHSGVHIIGHSHGGNVASDAAAILRWNPARRVSRLHSLTTVGTPFLRTNVSVRQRFGAWAFLALVMASLLLSIGSFVVANDVRDSFLQPIRVELEEARSELDSVEAAGAAASENAGEDAISARRAELRRRGLPNEIALLEAELQTAERNWDTYINGVRAVNVGSVLGLLFVSPFAFGGLRRIERVSRERRAGARLLAITHPEDEAIGFLKHVERIDTEPLPPGSFLRGGKTAAVIWGVRSALILPIIGGVLLLAGLLGLVDWLPSYPIQATLLAAGGIMLSIGLFGAPLIFAVVYAVYRLLVAPILEFAVRAPINAVIVNAVKGVALGRDGENRVGEVSAEAHYFETRQVILEGDLGDRVRQSAEDATLTLLKKYRAGIFAGGANAADGLKELLEDPTTWDGLIHTTYFDHEEVAEIIAEHVASSVRRMQDTE